MKYFPELIHHIAAHLPKVVLRVAEGSTDKEEEWRGSVKGYTIITSPSHKASYSLNKMYLCCTGVVCFFQNWDFNISSLL
jgi:hypothetical protein